MDITKLGMGFCLGDSFDCNSHYFPLNHNDNWEASWGNRKITRDLIRRIRDRGFQTVKLPVSWSEHLTHGAEGWEIEDWFIRRLREVVEMVLDEGMFCVINVHHDTDWITNLMLGTDYIKGMFETLWGLIALAFKEYPAKLLYESMNEVGFDGGNAHLHYELNQIFCSTVRSAEGNSDRTLLVEGVYADPSSTLRDFNPVDDDNYAIAVHFYTPTLFTLKDTPLIRYESVGDMVMDTLKDIENLQKIKDRYGVDVALTEFGCTRCNKTEEEVMAWYDAVIGYCARHNIPAIMWDDGKEIKEVVSRNDDMKELLGGFYGLLERYARNQ